MKERNSYTMVQYSNISLNSNSLLQYSIDFMVAHMVLTTQSTITILIQIFKGYIFCKYHKFKFSISVISFLRIPSMSITNFGDFTGLCTCQCITNNTFEQLYRVGFDDEKIKSMASLREVTTILTIISQHWRCLFHSRLFISHVSFLQLNSCASGICGRHTPFPFCFCRCILRVDVIS